MPPINDLSPDPGVTLAFLNDAFGHVAEPGLIEIAYSGTDGGAITRARLFDNTPEGRNEAATFAARVNAETGVNCYFAPSLRKIDTQRDRRAKKVNVLGSPMVWADFDAEGAAEAAKPIYEGKGLAPHRAIVTGRRPAKRAQAFWFLDALVHDHRELDEMLAGVHVGLDFVADPKVVNADRVMRLPGSIAWPKPGKEGRAAEPTELHTPGGAPAAPYAIERVRAVFPPRDPVAARKGQDVAPGGDLLSAAPVQATTVASQPSAPVSAPAAVMPEREFDMLGRRVDGRDDYAMKVIGGAIRNLAARLGRWPTADEIAADAWPTYERGVAPKNPTGTLEAEGRGPTWFGQKCQTHAERARTGAITGLETVEKCVAAVAAQGVQVSAAAPAVPLVLPPFKPFRLTDGSDIPRREFLYGRHLIRRFVSATVSPGGVGKSSLTLTEALAMASRRPLLGIVPERPLRVFAWNGEDPIDEALRRLTAAARFHGIRADEIADRIFVESGRDFPIKIAKSGRDGLALNEPLIDALCDRLRELAIDVVVIDPFVSCHSVKENDNDEIDAVVKAWARIADRANVAVELVHHSRKPPSGERDSVTTVDDARGAGALLAACRSARTINRMSEKEAERFGISGDAAWAYVRTDGGKQNLAPPADKAAWHKLEGFVLPNGDALHEGDNVGVMTLWTPPDAFDAVTVDHAARVRSEVGRAAEAGEHYRASDQAGDWVGHLVGEIVGFDTHESPGKARARAMVRTWIENRVLATETLAIGRKSRPVVVPGSEGLNP